jgi:hypothetical protein
MEAFPKGKEKKLQMNTLYLCRELTKNNESSIPVVEGQLFRAG